jgi:RNA polymerase sigma factor (sigma-70 family)
MFMGDLAALTVVVRRVIAARVSEPHLVEDLTQETLLRVASVERDMPSGERQAYAITTARNLITDHSRRAAVADRHLHQLLDTATPSSPEQHALQEEETAALAMALQQLPPADRALLLRHDVDGDSVDDLAHEAHTSSRALANRLARARATLRVEFVVTFRRAQLPTAECRPVLLALANGDRRRQHQLHAGRHVDRCQICADLAEPIIRRRRGIAAWLVLPADALRRAWQSLRHNHWTQAALVTVGATAAVAAFAVTRPDPPPQTASAPPAAIVSTTPAVTTPTTTSAPTTTPPPSLCPPPAPLDQQPSPPLGCPIAATAFTVIDVPADEGFWAQDSTGAAVWIQLDGDGESPFDITPGTNLQATGTATDPATVPTVAADPRTVARGFFLTVRYEDLVEG